MAFRIVSWCLFLTLFIAFEVTATFLDDNNECVESCDKSYAPHTYPNLNEQEACHRGCRFHMINNLIDPVAEAFLEFMETGEKPIKDTCHMSCADAYNESDILKAACVTGCEGKEQLERNAIKAPVAPQEDTSLLMIPLLSVRSVYSSFTGAVEVIRSSVVTFFMASNDTIVAVESDPTFVIVLPEEDSVSGKSDSASHVGISGTNRISSCLSRLGGVPPFLMMVTVMGILLFTFYCLFSTCFGHRKQKHYRNNLSISADTALPMPIKLLRPEDLTKLSLVDDDEQAPPLPIKIKLSDV